MTTTSPDPSQNPVTPTTGLTLSNKVYDALKEVAQVWLPAAGTLYFALASLWHLPFQAEIVGTIVAVDAFLGAGLHLSNVSYNKQITGA